eukprot:g18673.t1
MDEDTSSDQRLPHRRTPNLEFDTSSLEALGVLHWQLDAGKYEDDPALEKIRADRGYSYQDIITVSPEKLANYEDKIKSFYEEHMHTDEEIRYILEGSGYFDVRAKDEQWVRIKMGKGDMITLPAGMYHRFTLDDTNYIKAMRLFVGEPVWTPLNRPQDEHPMLSLVSVAAIMVSAAALPHPECEPCAKVSDAELEGLANSNKYLCCDLSCATDPVAGCGIFGLPIVCKACYDGDGTPAYDDPPVDGSPTPVPPTPEPVMPVMPVAPAPVPVMPVMPVMPAPTPVAAPQPVAMSYDFDPETDECDACEEAPMVLTEMDWEVLENDGYELICDPTCFEDATMDGCGAFGLPTECRAVPVPVPTGGDEGEGDGEVPGEPTGEGEGEGGGEVPGEPTGEGEGEGGGEVPGEPTGEGEGEGGGEVPGGDAGGCTAEEIAMCADISPAQEEALAMYDNGGKIIVCDPTCTDGYSDPSHCDYFGLGQKCRGCGSCSSCVPCP